MALNEEEEQILASLESQFGPVDGLSEHPQAQAAKNVAQNAVNREQTVQLTTAKPVFTARVAGMMAFLVIIGFGVLISGVMIGYTWVGISVGLVGFLMLLFAVTLPLNKIGRKIAGSAPESAQKGKAKLAKPAKGDFKTRMEEYWDKNH